MITGFEEFTDDLNDIELKAFHALANRLNRLPVGQKVKNSKMRQVLLDRDGLLVTEPRLRKVINAIRRSGIVPLLVATSEGYGRAQDVETVTSYIKSLHERESAIRAIRVSLMKQAQEHWNLKFDFDDQE